MKSVNIWTFSASSLKPLHQFWHKASMGEGEQKLWISWSLPPWGLEGGAKTTQNWPFLAHLSWKLKWAILIARCRSSVRPSVRLSFRLSVNFYIFNFFSRTAGPIVAKLGTNHPLVKEILNCSNKGPGRLQRGDNYKNAKMGGVIEKSSFPEPAG